MTRCTNLRYMQAFRHSELFESRINAAFPLHRSTTRCLLSKSCGCAHSVLARTLQRCPLRSHSVARCLLDALELCSVFSSHGILAGTVQLCTQRSRSVPRCLLDALEIRGIYAHTLHRCIPCSRGISRCPMNALELGSVLTGCFLSGTFHLHTLHCRSVARGLLDALELCSVSSRGRAHGLVGTF